MPNISIVAVETKATPFTIIVIGKTGVRYAKVFEKKDIDLSMKPHQMRNTSNIDWDDLCKSERREKIKDKLKTIGE